jgi:uncharacterized protein (DUF1499 family)
VQKLFLITLLIVAICITAFATIAFLSRVPAIGGVVDKEGVARLGDCPATPNCHGSQALRTEQTVEPLSLTVPANNAGAIIIEAIAELGGTLVKSDSRYLHASFQTSIMRYTDDVEFLIDATAGVVHIRSASRLGVSDLGANKKRIDAIRQQLANKL